MAQKAYDMNDQSGIPKQEIPAYFKKWVEQELSNIYVMEEDQLPGSVGRAMAYETYRFLHSLPPSPVGAKTKEEFLKACRNTYEYDGSGGSDSYLLEEDKQQ